MRRLLGSIVVLLLAGCSAAPEDPPATGRTPPPTAAGTSSTPGVLAPAPTSAPSPTIPAPTPADRPAPPRIVVTNGTLEEVQVNASTTYEIVFLLNASDRVRVNLVFHDLQRPAPYGWSGQVSLRAPGGRIVADSGTSMPESGAAFSLVLADLALDPASGPYEFLARARASHPTTLTARAYVDEAAG